MSDDFQITPTLGNLRSPMSCGYEVGGPCQRDAVWHIFWTPDLENGAACDEHYEASRRWAWYTAHRMNDVCVEGEGFLLFLKDGASTCVHPNDVDSIKAALEAELAPVIDLESGRQVTTIETVKA